MRRKAFVEVEEKVFEGLFHREAAKWHRTRKGRSKNETTEERSK